MGSDRRAGKLSCTGILVIALLVLVCPPIGIPVACWYRAAEVIDREPDPRIRTWRWVKFWLWVVLGLLVLLALAVTICLSSFMGYRMD